MVFHFTYVPLRLHSLAVVVMGVEVSEVDVVLEFGLLMMLYVTYNKVLNEKTNHLFYNFRMNLKF